MILKILIPIKTFLKDIQSFIYNNIYLNIKELLMNFNEHDGELSTCALAFYALISFIPASLVIISVLSFFYKSELMAHFYLDQVKHQLPSININDIIDIIDNIIYKKRYLAFIWIPFLFWWGSLVFDIIERVLEKAFRIEESHKYWKAKIRHILIILGIGIIILFFVFLSNILTILRSSQITSMIKANLYDLPFYNHLLDFMKNIPFLLTNFTALFTNTAMLFIIYRFVPPMNMDNISILKGALSASFIYELVKMIYSYYITEINDYTSIFGSLSTIVMLMIWIWFTCFIFVIGAEMAWLYYIKSKKSELLDFDH
jgi:membrane protein